MYNVRKRLVVKNRFKFTIFVIAAIAIANLIIFAFVAPAKTNADISHKTQTVYVSAGDTLWEIADTYRDEKTDIREMVYRIKQINQLKTANLSAGQTIEVPLD